MIIILQEGTKMQINTLYIYTLVRN